ncbi:MAG: ABC transporter substrate-binding protein, partial [Loktanella sp.]|nr:ABC transporter substrate-binding protein [Loktanella sp.]
HLQAAQEGLTMEYRSPMLDELQNWATAQAETGGYRTVGIYAGALGYGYNSDLVTDNPPACWADLLDERFQDDVQVANPNSSGTSYTMLATMVQLMGEDEAFDYLTKLHDNISQYTKSGSAPIRAAATGETAVGIVFQHDAVAQTVQGAPIVTVAPCEGTGYEVGSMSIIEGGPNPESAKVWYDWALSPAAQEIGATANSYQVPSNTNATTPPEAPKLADIKLIDYDFAEYGSSETRSRLLARWDAEIGALPN